MRQRLELPRGDEQELHTHKPALKTCSKKEPTRNRGDLGERERSTMTMEQKCLVEDKDKGQGAGSAANSAYH